MKVKLKKTEEDDYKSWKLYFWCPGCEDLHAIGPGWSYEIKQGMDGVFYNLTISPSILVEYGGALDGKRCHSFIEKGVWRYLDDSTHKYSGFLVAMVDIPDWLEM